MMVFLMVLIPLVMDEHRFPFEDIAHVLQIHSFGMFGPSIFIGFVVEKVGTIPIIITGLIILILSNIIMGSSITYVGFLLGMFLLGIGWNLVFITSTTLLIQTYRVKEKKNF